MRTALLMILVFGVDHAMAQHSAPEVRDPISLIPQYVESPDLITRMVTVDLDEAEFSDFRVHLKIGRTPTYRGEFESDTLASQLWNLGHIDRVKVGNRFRVRLFLRERWKGQLCFCFGRTLYEIPTDPQFRGLIEDTSIAPPPVQWDTLHASRKSSFDYETKRRLMQASVRTGTASNPAAGTVVLPPVELKPHLEEGEMLILCSGHQIPHQDRFSELIVDVPVLDGLKSVGFERLPARFIASSEGSDIGDQKNGDCGWLAFRPGKRTPQQVPLASLKRWYRSDQDLLQIGCPEGVLPTSRVVRAVSAERDHLGGSVNLSLPSIGGHSGGGVFDAEGYLVAVLVHTSDSSTHSFGYGLLDFRGRQAYSRSGEVSGAWHPSIAIDVAQRYFKALPRLQERELITVGKEMLKRLPQERRKDAAQHLKAFLESVK